MYPNFSDFKLVKSGHECSSLDEKLEDKNHAWQCASACREISGCKYFIFGYDDRKGKCWWEKTTSAACSEGWKAKTYNFYEMTGMLL